MDPEPDEYTLALAARQGDREALAALADRTRLRLFALAYAELRHYEDAQDAVASALLQICRHVGELRQPERIRAWMHSIVRNEVRRLRRGPGASELSLDEAPDAANDAVLSLLRLDIEHALRRLPGEQACVLRLFYLDELPTREIARRLGHPQGTITSWLHRGRRRLAAQMKEYAPMTPTQKPAQKAAIVHTDLDAAFIKRVTEAFRKGGYRSKVLQPGDPGRLIESLKAYEVIALDECIGGRPAFEYLMHLRTNTVTKQIPVCLFCTDPSDFSVAAYFTAGVNRLVNKNDPNDITRLETALEKPVENLWEKFTEGARRVIYSAQEEAARQGTNLVSPEHMLLGLTREPESVAGRLLVERLGVPLERVRSEVEQRFKPAKGQLEQAMQLTPRGTRIVEQAWEEAQSLNQNFIGTEHLLLALLRDEDGVAARVLTEVGADLERVRKEVDAVQGG
jgi:RNA polymerase sigma factor (sigma-70 family)